ncbi:MAG: flagellar assembly protein FliW [Eubacteriales bacterium]|nr:flagellar assembly protein FliW [Eubacteriales bacterium]
MCYFISVKANHCCHLVVLKERVRDMEINTRDFGLVEVNEEAIYEFPEGVYGFEGDKHFAVFEKPIENDVSLLYLQSVENRVPCFLVFDPTKYYPEYTPEIDKEDLADFSTTDLEELIFLVIATVPDSVKELSMNVKSPIVLDPKTRKAKQIILKNKEYGIKYQPFNLS